MMGWLPSRSTISPNSDRMNSEIHSEVIIEQVWRCTWRLSSREFGHIHLQGHDCANSTVEIEQIWRYNWMPCSCEFGDTPGGHECASWDMHSDAVIELVWRYAHGGHDRTNLEVVIEWVWRYNWRPWTSEFGDAHGGVLGGGQSGGSSSGGRHDRTWDSMYCLMHNYGNVENWVQHGVPREKRLAGSTSSRSWEDAARHVCSTQGIQVRSICNTQWMLYSVYAALSVNSRSWHGEIERNDFTLCS